MSNHGIIRIQESDKRSGASWVRLQYKIGKVNLVAGPEWMYLAEVDRATAETWVGRHVSDFMASRA